LTILTGEDCDHTLNISPLNTPVLKEPPMVFPPTPMEYIHKQTAGAAYIQPVSTYKWLLGDNILGINLKFVS